MGSNMKTEVDYFSGSKIYPSRGFRFVKTDNRSFRFIGHKTFLRFEKKINPRDVPWTRFYRKVNNKGSKEEFKKKKARKIRKAIVGATLDVIKAKANQAPAAGKKSAVAGIRNRKKAAANSKAAPKPAASKDKKAKKDKKKPAQYAVKPPRRVRKVNPAAVGR